MKQLIGPMAPVYLIVVSAFIGLSMPFPVFSHLFLNESSSLMGAATTIEQRTFLLGLAIALFPLGQALASPFWGAWSDKIGRKLVLFVSLGVASLGMLIVAISIDLNMLWLLLFGRLLSGLGEGNIAIAQAIAADDEDEQRRTKSFAGISIAINLGWIIGPLLGGFLADPDVFSWANAALPFWVGTVLYMLNMAFVRLIPDSKDKPHPELESPLTTKALWALPKMKANMLMSFLTFFAVYTMFSFYIPYLVQEFDFSVVMAGIYSALFSVPLIAAGLMAHKVQKGIGSRKMAIASVWLLSIGLLGFGLAPNITLIVIFTIVVSFGIVFIEVSSALLVSQGVPNQANGQVIGSYRSVTVISEITAAMVGGVLAGLYLPMPFIGAAALVLLSLYLLKK
ncbi:MFS transporter [Paraferrimonas sp. SM1919]|uniref:MFS transporter n=1 Tax=Paraferrimonas sp. SM1919 TaxID=2662263 RepID=UPI0013CF6C80|nr:MFS transporter [Paraferrimonas sp. SM1919]